MNMITTNEGAFWLAVTLMVVAWSLILIPDFIAWVKQDEDWPNFKAWLAATQRRWHGRLLSVGVTLRRLWRSECLHCGHDAFTPAYDDADGRFYDACAACQHKRLVQLGPLS